MVRQRDRFVRSVGVDFRAALRMAQRAGCGAGLLLSAYRDEIGSGGSGRGSIRRRAMVFERWDRHGAAARAPGSSVAANFALGQRVADAQAGSSLTVGRWQTECRCARCVRHFVTRRARQLPDGSLHGLAHQHRGLDTGSDHDAVQEGHRRDSRLPAFRGLGRSGWAEYPRERIAVDGTVLDGKALVDQAALTGESVPVEKEEGSLVYAATVVREGKLYIRADRIGSETEAGQILRLVEAAPARETKIQNYAVKWANDLVPYSFAGGAFAGIVMAGGLQGAAAVLIIDYGTGIRIAAPTTVLSAMTKAIRNGILIKGGRHLENLAEVDAVVFDKTGTLTIGQPDVLEVVPVNSSSPDEVLTLAAAAELRLTHPVADAIVKAAEAHHLSIPERTASDYSLGLGVEAIVNDSIILVGSPRFMTLRNVALSPEVEEHMLRMQQQAVS